MRTAVFGGSFDPVHNGHVGLARAFTDALALDRLIVIPAFVSPFKTLRGSSLPQHRLEMCRLAFAPFDDTMVSTIELEREGASYTCDTLTALSEEYPDDSLYLITGADSFLTIQRWKSPEIIFRKAVICTVPRNDDDIGELRTHARYLRSLGAETELLDARVMKVSSTEIRERIARGEDITGLVPETVEKYIAENGLYRSV